MSKSNHQGVKKGTRAAKPNPFGTTNPLRSRIQRKTRKRRTGGVK